MNIRKNKVAVLGAFVFQLTVFLLGCNQQPQKVPKTKTEPMVQNVEMKIDSPSCQSGSKYRKFPSLYPKQELHLEIDTDLIYSLDLSDIDQKAKEAGMVPIQQVDSTIYVDLRYASTRNFMGINLYGDLHHAYLQKEVAESLQKAQSLLQSKHPGYSLLLFDGFRPRRVQQIMWQSVKLPVKEKIKFLSNPSKGSLHNFGAAVDLTIIDSNCTPLDMGTAYDYVGHKAYPRLETQMLKDGVLDSAQLKNRILLRNLLKEVGFSSITTEWWHFNYCSRKEAYRRFPLVE